MVFRRRLVAALLVPFGVCASHVLGYLIAHPDATERAELLGTGHDHLGPLAVCALAGFVGAIVVSGRSGATGRRFRVDPRALALAQATALLGLEFAEHVSHVQDFGRVLHEPAIWLALGIQVCVALLSTAVVRLSQAVGARWARRRRQHTGSTTRPWSPHHVLALVGDVAGRIEPRGPPSLTA